APGYTVQNDLVQSTKFNIEIPLKIRSNYSLYGKAIHQLVVKVDYETKERLHIKIVDKDHKQPVVPNSPLGLQRPRNNPVYNHNYDFHYADTPSFGFQVTRKMDNEVVFDTRRYPIIFEDQYLELTTSVPNDANIYGLGESIARFRRHHNTTSIFTTGPPTPLNTNSYGHHPFYTEIRNGKAHGVLLLNAHGMDYALDKGKITWKVIGGVLDFYLFVPQDRTPNSVIQLYTDVIGKPAMPAMWSLGWHQCRNGYKNISEADQVINKYTEHQIPLETMWLDIDYMDRFRGFTLDPIRFPKDRVIAMKDKLHKNHQRLVTIVEPAFGAYIDDPAYAHGHRLDVFMKNPDGSEYRGLVWPGFTTFLDSWHPNAQRFWNQEIASWMREIEPDGIWLDMNEPYSFCLGSCGSGKPAEEGIQALNRDKGFREMPHDKIERKKALDTMTTTYSKDPRNLLYPSYKIHNYFGDLSEQTIAMSTLHYGDIPHYDLHSLYGHAEVHLTYQAILNYNEHERPFILTRSSFAGTGKYAAHWTGDNYALWEYLQLSIPTILNFQLFGIPMTGADICGFGHDATEEICTRWHALGAFYPFARNHVAESSVPHYPYQWGSTAEAARRALAIRYALLPYIYTLFQESHITGVGPWRPLIFEYPEQDAFLDNDKQVLLGPSVLISPVLDQGMTTVNAQFPSNELWYDWYTYELLDSETDRANGDNTVITRTLDAPLVHIPLHIRGGSILPLKTPRLLVKKTMETPYTLLIALDQYGSAKGQLYIDDGHSLD
ncbi:alpha glucosidase, partial [Phascolomyces articulosus]